MFKSTLKLFTILYVRCDNGGYLDDIGVYNTKAKNESEAIQNFLSSEPHEFVLSAIFNLMSFKGYEYISKQHFPNLLQKISNFMDNDKLSQ